MPNNKETVKPKTQEELLINGASIVFYSAFVLDKPLSNESIDLIDKGDEPKFSRITSSMGYIEKMFALAPSTENDHLVYKHLIPFHLPPTEISDSTVIIPKLSQTVTLYSRRILLITSIVLFDRREVSRHPDVTNVERPLNTDDILKLIHDVQTDGHECNVTYAQTLDGTISDFLAQCPAENNPRLTFKKSDKSIAVQIWDIASLKVKKKQEIDGEELSKKYAWEIAALLSCYNEHFARDGLWRQQSPTQVDRTVRAETDVLRDHRILVSEQVCLEISQIDHPKLRAVSASRLYSYGYDSTSIFLWGYLVMLTAGIEDCEIRSKRLMNQMLTELNEKQKDQVANPASANGSSRRDRLNWFVVQRMQISQDAERLESLVNQCIEERHKFFLKRGSDIRGFNATSSQVSDTFEKAKELAFDYSQVILAADSSDSNEHTNQLLQELKSLNQEQSESSRRIGVLNILVGYLAVVPVTEFFVGLIPSLNTVVGKSLTAIGMLILISLILIASRWIGSK